MINGLPGSRHRSFTGDPTHDAEDKDGHAQRMKQFLQISKADEAGEGHRTFQVSTMPGSMVGSCTGSF